MLSGEDEEGKGTIKVLAVLVCPNAIRVAVGEEILRGHVSTVGIALQEGSSLLDEVFTFFDRLFDIDDVGRRELGNGEGLGGIDHEHCKLELEVWVLRLFGVGAIELKSSFVRQEGGLLSGAQVRMIEDWTWRGRMSTDGLCSGGAWGARCGLERRLIALVKVIRLG
jgi:hypothetical protein